MPGQSGRHTDGYQLTSWDHGTRLALPYTPIGGKTTWKHTSSRCAAVVPAVFVFVAHHSLVSEKYGMTGKRPFCTTCGFHKADDGLGNSPSHSVTRPKKSTDVRIEQSLIAKITTPVLHQCQKPVCCPGLQLTFHRWRRWNDT